MQSNEERTRIQQLLLDMFSNASPAVIFNACEINQWNTESCIDYLLTKKCKDSRSNYHGAIPKDGIRASKANVENCYSFSLLEQKVIDNIRLGYRVLVLMRGAPGSGKSTLARGLINESIPYYEEYGLQHFIFSSDDYFYDNNGQYEYKIEKLSRAHEWNQKRVQEKTNAGWSPIVVDNTNMQIWEMIPYIKTALRNGYIIEILEPRTSWKKIPEKLAAKNSHGVPRDKIHKMLSKFESATITDIVKAMKNPDRFGPVPQMRCYPPIQCNKTDDDSSSFKVLYQPKPFQNIKLNSINTLEDCNEKSDQTSKFQKLNFSSKTVNSGTSEEEKSDIFNKNSCEEISNKTDDILFNLLRQSNEFVSQKKLDEIDEKSVKSSFERHTVDCPNENQVFALLRQVYDNKSVCGLWDLFVKCNGNIDKAIDMLLKDDKLCSTEILCTKPQKTIDNYACNCENNEIIFKDDVRSSNSVAEKNTSSLLSQNDKQTPNEKQTRKNIMHTKTLNYTLLQSAPELVDSSTQTDSFEEKDNYLLQNDNEMVKIDFDVNIIEQLRAIFQSETAEKENLLIQKNMCLNILLPRTLAKDLYMLCMESICNKMEEDRQQTLHEDEQFAKLIQNWEYGSSMKVPQTAQDFNDLKMAFELLALDSKSNTQLENSQRSPLNLAAQLTLLKLSDEFPETPTETLSDILQAHNNNYQDTVTILKANNVKCDMRQQKKNSREEKNPMDHNSNNVASKKSGILVQEAKRLALSKFEESRNLAVHHCQLKGECYQKAKEMIQKGNGSVAVYYSHIANLHKRKIEMYNQCAANSIIEVHRYSKNNSELLDLHYLHVAEAMGCLDLFLDHHISSLRIATRLYKHVFIITGRGLHSIGGVSTIKNKVKNRLKERNLRNLGNHHQDIQIDLIYVPMVALSCDIIEDMKSRRISGLHLVEKHQGQLAKLSPKYSDEDWEFNNRVKFRITCDQERLAERIMEESRRVVDEANDTTKGWQREVEHHLRERASEIRFLCDELNRQKKTGLLEDEALSTYRNRILNAIEFLKGKSLAICQRCLVLREGRIGVDLCDDEVDRQLRQELKTIKNCQLLMDKALKETTEQIRKLRATMYLLDKDLAQKDKSLLIDEKNLTLRETQANLGMDSDFSQHHCFYSFGEWEHTTYKNLENNAKELNSAAQLRGYIDLVLKQFCEDMQNQTDRTNEAFERRINEIKHIKHCLENKSSDCMIHINEVQRNIKLLEKELSDKQRSLSLCQTRLSNRARRPGLELTCDTVQDALYHELNALQTTLCKLKQKIAENTASLRYLMHVHVMQEEEINIKANSIKIDEVDCMTIRQILKYSTF